MRACHPAPTAAVTVIVSALAAKVGWSGWALVGLAFAVLLGQLSIGWSNDAVDAEDDASAVRLHKPTVASGLDRRALLVTAGVTATVACGLSWAVAGWLGGTCHVIGIVMGWLYNVRLSRTAWAWLPYAVAFGLLPSFVTVGLDGTWPPVWLTVAFAVIGVSAHLANSLRDLDIDDALGLDGTAHRLGGRRTRLLAAVLLGIGALVVVFAIATANPVAGVVALAAVAALLIALLRADA